MLSLLSRLFIRDNKNYSSPAVRSAYGVVCGAMGIFFNIVLFAVKFFAGAISGSVAITADAFNNLSDAGSSVIMLVGFRLSGQKPDHEHPFGHGRIEYIAGLAVSMLILLMGAELAKTSVEKIITPEKPEFGYLTFAILVFSVIVKFYMFFYNKKTAKNISSSSMNATAYDSISDCAATSVVIISSLISHYSGVNIDGWAGVAVSLFIAFTGFKALKETVGPLLGNPPDPKLVSEIEETVRGSNSVIGLHDLVVHDYGPGRMMISLHAEVPASGNITDLHDDIDNLEKLLKSRFGCEAVIHMDPIETDDKTVAELRARVTEAVKQIDERITIHDFRTVVGSTHTNLIFDAVVPYDIKLGNREILSLIDSAVKKIDAGYYAVVEIDNCYVK